MVANTKPRGSKAGTGSKLVTSVAATLALLYTEPEDVRISALARRLGLTERSTMVMLQELQRLGYVIPEREGRENRYKLTPEGFELGERIDKVLEGEGVEL